MGRSFTPGIKIVVDSEPREGSWPSKLGSDWLWKGSKNTLGLVSEVVLRPDVRHSNFFFSYNEIQYFKTIKE